VANTTREKRERATVILASLICKPDESEEKERAKDKGPAKYLGRRLNTVAILPNGARDLDDLGIVAVCVVPAHPWCDTVLRIVYDEISPHRDSSKYFDGGNGHQADVAATFEARVR
jgi:hypothetical protein